MCEFKDLLNKKLIKSFANELKNAHYKQNDDNVEI